MRTMAAEDSLMRPMWWRRQRRRRRLCGLKWWQWRRRRRFWSFWISHFKFSDQCLFLSYSASSSSFNFKPFQSCPETLSAQATANVTWPIAPGSTRLYCIQTPPLTFRKCTPSDNYLGRDICHNHPSSRQNLCCKGSTFKKIPTRAGCLSRRNPSGAFPRYFSGLSSPRRMPREPRLAPWDPRRAWQYRACLVLPRISRDSVPVPKQSVSTRLISNITTPKNTTPIPMDRAAWTAKFVFGRN